MFRKLEALLGASCLLLVCDFRFGGLSGLGVLYVTNFISCFSPRHEVDVAVLHMECELGRDVSRCAAWIISIADLSSYQCLCSALAWSCQLVKCRAIVFGPYCPMIRED